MHKRLVVAIAVAIGTFPTIAFAQSGNVRILLHGTKQVASGNFFNWSGWVVGPNVANVPSKWLVVTGPRLQGENWWSEFNVGAFVHDGDTESVIDVRTDWPFLKPLSLWTNFQTNFRELSYVYGEVNYPLPGGFIVGIETENVPRDLSFGPHLYIPFGEAVVHAVYQFHGGEDQFWFRLVVNFR